MLRVEDQVKMFGRSLEHLREEANAVCADAYELNNYAMSILSDAQEELVRGNSERSRQFINCAKFIISESNSVIRQGN